MSTTVSGSGTLITEPTRSVATGAAQDDSLATRPIERDRQAWRQIIDEKLIEWGRDPLLLEEDDLIPPTREAIQVASWLAMWLRDQGAPAPRRVVPDRDGGLVFERWKAEETETFMVSSEGGVELLLWLGSKIVESRRLC